MNPLRLLVLTRYERLGSSSRVRAYQFLPFLRSQGFDVEVSALLSDDYVIRLYNGLPVRVLDVAASYITRVRRVMNASSFNLLWIEKEALPWVPAAWELGLLSRAGVPFVADYDDAVFHAYENHRSPFVRWMHGDRINRIMRGAAAVVVGNPYIRARARVAGVGNVIELPSVVDLERYPETERQAPETGRPVVGWMGSPATDRFLEIVAEPLRAICARHDARLLCVGSARALPGVPVLHEEWSEESESRVLAQMDVGIMPLPDTPFTRGKCGYKLIQYMAARLPVVASPVGVNRNLVEHGVTGLLADSAAEWEAALDTLLGDRTLRKTMGAAGRRVVERQYSTAVVAPLLAAALRAAAGQAGPSDGSRA